MFARLVLIPILAHSELPLLVHRPLQLTETPLVKEKLLQREQ